MKKQSPKQSAKRNAKRPAPVGNGETAQGAPSQTAHPSGEIVTAGTPDNAKRARPVFVDESDAAEMANFEPSPQMYTCACAFLCNEIRNAYLNGDNDLLARDGIAEALEYLTIPDNAGTDAKAFCAMFEEWKEETEKQNAEADRARAISESEKVIRRLRFWSVFDDTNETDADNVDWRRYFLGRNARLALLLRTAKKTGDNVFCDKIADAVFEAKSDIEKTRKEHPENIRAEWLNDIFSQTGEALADWLGVAALPDYSRTVEELRKRIADNFGVFPAPFVASELGRVVLATDALEKLRYIARDMRRRFVECTNLPAANSCAAQGAGIAGAWAAAHGVKGYNGLRFEFHDEVIEKPEQAPKRWWIFREVIESTETDGAAYLGNKWRGRFSTAKGDYKLFSRYIHPVKDRGAGWYHIESREIKGRQGW